MRIETNQMTPGTLLTTSQYDSSIYTKRVFTSQKRSILHKAIAYLTPETILFVISSFSESESEYEYKKIYAIFSNNHTGWIYKTIDQITP